MNLREIYDVLSGVSLAAAILPRWFDLLSIPIFVALVFVRARWIGGIVIIASLVWLMKGWWFMALAGEATRT